MSSEELKAKTKQVEGKTREEVGKMTGDTSEQVKGKAEQVEGRIQEEVSKPIPEGPPRVTQVTEESKTTAQQTTETSEVTSQPGGAEKAADTSGQVIGAGLKKIENVVDEFTAGLSKGMKADQPPRQEEQQIQETQQTREAPQTYVTEEEKVKKKEIKQD